MFGALGAMFTVGCGTTAPTSTAGAATPAEGGTTCAAIPGETEGPYPDKTGMLGDAAYRRSDITEGKAGVPLTMTFTVVSASGSCAPIEGATVMVWHCDNDGKYSEYD